MRADYCAPHTHMDKTMRDPRLRSSHLREAARHQGKAAPLGFRQRSSPATSCIYAVSP